MNCDCIKLVDEGLAADNAMVDTATMTFDAMTRDDFAELAVVRLNVCKIDSSRSYGRGGKPWIMARFCPFCGKAYENPKGSEGARLFEIGWTGEGIKRVKGMSARDAAKRFHEALPSYNVTTVGSRDVVAFCDATGEVIMHGDRYHWGEQSHVLTLAFDGLGEDDTPDADSEAEDEEVDSTESSEERTGLFATVAN